MEIPPQNEYGLNNQLIPRYKFIRYGPTNVSQAVFQPTNTSLVSIRIPALSTVNFAKSFIQYSLTLPAGGANNWTALTETGCDFTTVQLQPSTALNIVDISFANKYVHMMQPYRSKMEVDFISGANDILTKNRCSFQNAQNNIQVSSQDGLTTLPGVYAGPLNLLDRQMLSFSTQPNQAVSVNRNVPLSVFANSVLSLNKDLYFSCDMYLNLTLAPLYQVYTYTSTPQTPGNLATQTLPAASITCSSFNLYLAIEVNESITKSLIADINQGPMKIPIPYVYNSVQITPSAVSQSSNSFIISKNNGRQLNAVVLSVWNINQNTILNYDNQNVQGCKISSYNTFIDSTALQQGQQNCFSPNAAYNPLIWTSVPYSTADDFRNNRDVIKGSCICNYAQYGNDWAVWDTFGFLSFEDESQQLSNQWWTSELSGLSLLSPSSGDHLYSVSFNCPGTNPGVVAATNSQGSIVMFSTLFSRFLSIDASGVYLSS